MYKLASVVRFTGNATQDVGIFPSFVLFIINVISPLSVVKSVTMDLDVTLKLKGRSVVDRAIQQYMMLCVSTDSVLKCTHQQQTS